MKVRKQSERGMPPITMLRPFEVDSVFTSECPASVVTQRAVDLVQIVGTLMSVHSAAGSMVSPDLPGSVIDALRICQSESRAADAAQDDAVANF